MKSSALAPTRAAMITQISRSMHLVAVDAGGAGAPHRQPEAQQVGGGQQHAVGIDGERSELKQDWMHGVPAPRISRIMKTTPTVMAASATLNAQKCQPRQ